ncbi:MAG: NHLP leader peptide family RiPP precursor [Halanaerobiales bacterium]
MTIEKGKLEKVITELMERAARDEEYRELVLKDSAKAIEEIAPGLELPDDFTVRFIEGDPEADLTIVLPPLKTELSDEELDDVAGGSGHSIGIFNWFKK